MKYCTYCVHTCICMLEVVSGCNHGNRRVKVEPAFFNTGLVLKCLSERFSNPGTVICLRMHLQSKHIKLLLFSIASPHIYGHPIRTVIPFSCCKKKCNMLGFFCSSNLQVLSSKMTIINYYFIRPGMDINLF